MSDYFDPKKIVEALDLELYDNEEFEDESDSEIYLEPSPLSLYSVNEAKKRSRSNYYFMKDIEIDDIKSLPFCQIKGYLAIDSKYEPLSHHGTTALFMFDEFFKKQYIKVVFNDMQKINLINDWDSYCKLYKIDRITDSEIDSVKEYIPVILTAKVNFEESVEFKNWDIYENENEDDIELFFQYLNEKNSIPYPLLKSEKERIKANWEDNPKYRIYNRIIVNIDSWEFYFP